MNKIEALTGRGFKFNKALGQNFITDSNLLRAITDDAGITVADTVVEIGAGAGTLTAELAIKAKRVLTFEVDQNLLPFLSENLSAYNNVQIFMRDILRTPHNELSELIAEKKGSSSKELTENNSAQSNSKESDVANNPFFKVVANLPYYITTPVLFYFLESGLAVESITVMVQSEVAKRMTAKPATADYGALTLAIAARSRAQITRFVSRNMFTPRPNVDSAVVRLDILSPFDAHLSRVIKSLFAMRRKTAVNNLSAGFNLPKAVCGEILSKAGLSEIARGEEFGIEEVKRIATLLKN